MTRSRLSAKKAGTRFETQVAEYLADALDDDRIERRARNGANDRGDIGGVRRDRGPIAANRRVVLEVKNTARTDLPGWVREAHLEAGNDDALVGVVVAKRHGIADPAQQWVHMTLADLVVLLSGARGDDEEDPS